MLNDYLQTYGVTVSLTSLPSNKVIIRNSKALFLSKLVLLDPLLVLRNSCAVQKLL